MFNVERGPDAAGSPELGRRVRAARARTGMTRRQLADISGTSERYLANIERGVGNPSLGVLHALAVALKVAVAELLPLGGERYQAHADACALLRRLSDSRVAELIEWLSRSAPHVAKGGRIVLIGLRGAGKTSLGQGLAARLHLPFIEFSEEVSRAYGGDTRLLVEFGGQHALRRYEDEAWEGVMRSFDAAVIATPDGIVVNSILYGRLLQTAHSVWLSAAPDDHLARAGAQGELRSTAGTRSAIDDLKVILDSRIADYARVDIRIDTSAKPFDDTLDALERAVRAATTSTSTPT